MNVFDLTQLESTRACDVRCGATLKMDAHCAGCDMREVWCVIPHTVPNSHNKCAFVDSQQRLLNICAELTVSQLYTNTD